MFTAYDNNPEPVLTPDYGELIFKYTMWGEYDNGTFFEKFEDLPTHYCTDKELGLAKDGKDARFLPIRPSLKVQLEFYKPKMQCTDATSMMISGDYSSSAA